MISVTNDIKRFALCRICDAICISEGPGSYTGVRIAMSIAKTISELLNIE